MAEEVTTSTIVLLYRITHSYCIVYSTPEGSGLRVQVPQYSYSQVLSDVI